MDRAAVPGRLLVPAVTWRHSTVENQWVCEGCGYMRPGAMPTADHECDAAVEPAAPVTRVADDVDAIHARIEALRAERG